MKCRTINKPDENTVIELIEFDRDEFIIWNEKTKSIYDYMCSHLENHNITFNIFNRMFRKGSMLALLFTSGKICGLFTWKKQKVNNSHMLHIDALIISNKYRGTKKMFFFIDQVFLTLQSCFNSPDERLLLYNETRYNLIIKYLKTYFTLLSPHSKSNAPGISETFEYMREYYQEYIKHYCKGMIYNQDTNTLRLREADMSADNNSHIYLKEFGELSKDEFAVIFCEVREQQLKQLERVKHTIKVAEAKYLKGCLVSEHIRHNGTYSGRNAKIAIIDTGIAHHEDNIIGGIHIFYKNNRIYTDENYFSDEQHGNIAVRIINSICPDSGLFIVRALSEEDCHCKQLIEGIYRSVDSGVDIISIGGSTLSSINRDKLKTACDYAFSKGCIIIAPRDINSRKDSYPFSFSNVIGVGITSIYNMILLDRSSWTIKTTPEWIEEYEDNRNRIGNISLGSSIANYLITGIVAMLWKHYRISNADKLWNHLEEIGIPCEYIENYLFE